MGHCLRRRRYCWRSNTTLDSSDTTWVQLTVSSVKWQPWANHLPSKQKQGISCWGLFRHPLSTLPIGNHFALVVSYLLTEVSENGDCLPRQWLLQSRMVALVAPVSSSFHWIWTSHFNTVTPSITRGDVLNVLIFRGNVLNVLIFGDITSVS